jgi:hypothetical protein
MQCKGRFCKETKELKFPLLSGYFTERRCTEVAAGQGIDPELCLKCQEKSQKPFVNKNQQYYYQGKVDQPYFDASWLFGSKRFLEYNAKPGNSLSEKDFATAEAAQRIARQGLQIQEIPMPPKKSTSAQIQPKTTVAPKAKTPTPSKTTALAVETQEEPLEAEEVHIVKVRSSEVNGKPVWIDTETEEIYNK